MHSSDRLVLGIAAAMLLGCSPAPRSEGPGAGPVDAGSQPPGNAGVPSAPNPIEIENQQAGSAGWQIDGALQATSAELGAYADATSVDHGESVGVHVASDAAHTATWELYRVGYYGGLGGRLFATGGPVPISPQPVPAADPQTGLIECHWPTTFTLRTDASWPSGFFLLKLIRDDGVQRYVPLVVRADERKGVGVVQAAVNTYQAYNAWRGESLYADALGLSGGHAKEVSFDRPYEQGLGAGDFPIYEDYFIQWIESYGFDVTYATNVDIATRDVLSGQKLFMSVGHDEYWSRAERDAVDTALASGVNVAFFSGNSAYWQVRLEPEHAGGAPNRTEVCYKDQAPSEDPLAATNLITMRWRDPGPGAPEEELLGIMYQSWQAVDVPFVVANSGHWAFAGTGLRDGDAIPFVVGNESDRYYGDSNAPSGVEVLGSSPTIDRYGQPSWHNAGSYVAPSGAFVFAAGSIEWSWGLARPGTADARIQTITKNVLEHAGLSATLPGSSFGAETGHRVDRTGAATSVTTLAGVASREGLQDGPARSALFRRPSGVAVDPSGRIFVVDTGNHAIRLIGTDSNRTVQTIVGDGTPGLAVGPGSSARLSSPTGIAIGPYGALYVTDTGNNRVLRVSAAPPWNVSVLAGPSDGSRGYAEGTGPNARFYGPMGIAMVGSTAYVADSGNDRLRAIDGYGRTTTVVGDGVAGSRDGAGRGARLNYPTAVAAAAHALWVVETQNHALRSITLDGRYTTSTVAGGSWAGGYEDGAGPAAALLPIFGLAGLGSSLIVADTGNNLLRKVTAGAVTTFAGSGGTAPNDGAAASAGMMLPMGLAATPDGKLVVAVDGDSTIRLVAP